MSHNQSKSINITNVIMSPASPYTSHQVNRLMNRSTTPVDNASLRHSNVINQIPVKASAVKSSRHTIAITNDTYDQKYPKQYSFESSNNNSSPLSKTPESTNDNWMSIDENLPYYKTIVSPEFTESSGNLVDSDHEMLETNATGLSVGGEESADDDLDSGYHNASGPTFSLHDDFDDNTTKRLKTFVSTTLHYEKLYLDKLKKLLDFKEYLDDKFNGSETDINVLFSSIQQIYTTHDIVAQKLQDYLNTLNDLLQSNPKASPVSTKLNQVVGSSRQATNLSPTSPFPTNSMSFLKESFLTNALNLLANIMEISFPVYLEFLKNYPKSMTILSKLDNPKGLSKQKTLTEYQNDFNKISEIGKVSKKSGILSRFTQKTPAVGKKDPLDLYYNDTKNEELLDLTRIFTDDILRRPTKLFEFIFSLKEECILASNDLPNSYCASLKSNIKSLFDNEGSKNLREMVFSEINRNIMPKEVRKNEDVVELIENNNDRKLRHLILFGDCLVCCRLKKDKRQLKWFIPIDQLEIFTEDYKSAKSENELKHLRDEVVSLRGNLKKQTEENASARNQQKIKKKLAEQENELTIQSSRLKLIIRANPLLSSSATSSSSSNSSSSLGTGGFSGHLVAALSSSMNNLANLTTSSLASNKNSHQQHNYYQGTHLICSSPTQHISNSHVFLFTSDFERNSWLEEINGAIYALKSRKTQTNLQHSDLESRINSLKKIEEPPKIITSSYTGSLELLVRNIDILEQPNKVYVAVELKSCGSYLEVAQTRCSDLTTSPVWEEKFTLELQSVDSLRIILYSQTSGKALAIASQVLKIDSNVNLNKINCVRLSNGISLYITMKFLSQKKTITRRRTRNRNDIFGGNLNDLLQREKSTIPRILKDCVEVIETKGIEEVGIYRVSSVVSEVQKIKDLYSKNPTQALNELRQKSPHLSANVLKLYLRELPDPLFTSHLYNRFMSAVDCQVHEFRLSELCRIFNQLPEPNKNIILFIINHLKNIADHSDKNLMSLRNLCTLFGPTLMKLSPKDNLQAEDMNREIKESMLQAQILFYILQLNSDGKLIPDSPESFQKSDSNVNLIDNQIENLKRLNVKSKSHTDGNNNNIPSSQKSKSAQKSNVQTAL